MKSSCQDLSVDTTRSFEVGAQRLSLHSHMAAEKWPTLCAWESFFSVILLRWDSCSWKMNPPVWDSPANGKSQIQQVMRKALGSVTAAISWGP